jgi:hypothetical protein
LANDQRPKDPVKHLVSIVASASIAIGVTVLLLNYGAHDIEGFLAYMVGCIGFVVHDWLTPHSDSLVLVTIANFTVY